MPRPPSLPWLLLAAGVLPALACGGPTTSPSTTGSTLAPAPAPTEAEMTAQADDFPPTRRDDTTEVLHGVTVADPYRWLELVDGEGVRAWMDAQDAHARRKLAALPARDALLRRFTELAYVDVISPPVHEGGRWFFTRTHADKEKGIVYVRDAVDGPERVLLDPNTMSADGSVSLRGFWPSRDGKLVAYKLSRNNADASIMYVRDVATGRDLPDVIEGAKYAAASWTPDSKGFYYTWLPTDPKIPIADLPGYAEVRFHRLGTDESKDEIVHPATRDPKKFIGAGLSRDGRWLFVELQSGWNRTDVYVKDLSRRNAKLEPLVVGKDALYGVTAWKGTFYVWTNEGAPRYRVFAVDPARRSRTQWKEIVAERADTTIEGMQIVGGHLVLTTLRNAASGLEVRTLGGKLVREVPLPSLGSTAGMVGQPEDDDAYFAFTSFTEPQQVYRTSIATGKTSLWAKTNVPADLSAYETEQVFYPSKDGTKVSMFLVHKKGWKKDGTHPVLLYGYGGFNVSLNPWYSSLFVVWLEQGGVVAVPNLRGGGEYGEAWHRAGMLDRKQNVFDDYVAAAEWLIANRITAPERLAIYGGSNGGLLVGAAMTQRPDLYGAVVCAVPLLDMVRYHLFGSGKTWIEEYGSADDPALFKVLHAYSPYHRVEPGTAYPALLMLAADSDDRVDPMHARKFVAAVQHAVAGRPDRRPVWLRIEKNAGHGGADLRKQKVVEGADVIAFLRAQLGVR